MHTIKLMPEYGSFPIWRCNDIRYVVEPEELPISESLKQALQEWANVYDNTIDMNDPASAGFKSNMEMEIFEKIGLELWKQLKTELGDGYIIKYFSTIEQRILVDGEISDC